ncbi:MAG: metallophosphoesterase [Myxococcota bacterium]
MKRWWMVICVVGCLRPSEDAAKLDDEVGIAASALLQVEETDGLASVRAIDDASVELWAASPVLHLRVIAETEGVRRFTVDNAMPGAVPDVAHTLLPSERGTQLVFDAELSAGEQRIRIAPPDADLEEPWRFGVLSDIQEAIGRVGEIFMRMNDEPEMRFVISSGDLTSSGTRGQLERFQDELELLDVPFFSTTGNHEASGDELDWHELFGPFSSSFAFRGVSFSLVDSSGGTIDPRVYNTLDEWLDGSADRVHVFTTHYALFDPAGLRNGSFKSRNEAARLANRLAAHDVDVLFFGHVHSYYAFSIAEIPSYISGGGGAIEERLDGIQRHFLRVDVDPAVGIENVALVRVDNP